MLPPRHRLPTPAWAEMLPASAAGDDTFRPFSHGESFDRTAPSTGAHHFDCELVARSGADEDDAPQLGLF